MGVEREMEVEGVWEVAVGRVVGIEGGLGTA